MQLQGARILGIPVIVTEQYPKGLGSTVQEIDLTGAKLVLPKTKFSMVLPEVETALADIPGVRSVVLFGVEVGTFIILNRFSTAIECCYLDKQALFVTLTCKLVLNVVSSIRDISQLLTVWNINIEACTSLYFYLCLVM